MKRKADFIEEKVGDSIYLYPAGENVDGRIFSMNDTCKYVWDLLESDRSESEVIDAVAAFYGIEREVVANDIKEVLLQMSCAGIIDM